MAKTYRRFSPLISPDPIDSFDERDSFTTIDPKGDVSSSKAITFMREGQLPCAEWFKSISEGDTLPRGKCRRWLENNPEAINYKKYVSSIRKITSNRKEDLEAML